MIAQSIDKKFHPIFKGEAVVYSSVKLKNGNYLISGNFNSSGSTPVFNLVEIDSTGKLVTALGEDISSAILQLEAASDGGYY